MLISEKTRRNIFDELRLENICWYGRMDEIAFIKRVFDITELPSTDGRFENMEGDIRQHRYNNDDWENDWIYEDNRLNLIKGSDEDFLKLMCEILHPLVRIDEEERNKILEIINDYLSDDGFKLVAIESGRKLRYYPVKTDENSVNVENVDKFSRPFIKEQLEKCNKKLSEGDFDGAITNARSLLEDVIVRDLHTQFTGKAMDSRGDLTQDYRKIKALLNLSEHTQVDEAFKAITSGITSIVSGVDTIGNKMGDRHSRALEPQRHHSKLVVNSVKTIVDFLYDVLEYQKSRHEKYRTTLLKLPYIRYGTGKHYKHTCRGLKDRDYILNIDEYMKFYKRLDGFSKRMLINELINNFEIKCFDNADTFFISLIVLFDAINQDDMINIFNKTKGNSQSDGNLKFFLEEVSEIKPELATRGMIEYVDEDIDTF